jgi:DNA polymerase/3'-5' exonuclease PolX
MMKKQSTLFPKNEATILAELDLRDAETLAQQIKTAVEAHCQTIEIAGSIRRQKTKVHDIDFVVVAKNDADWQKISEKLKHLKAKPNCSGNSLIKAFLPCHNGLFQVDFYRANPSTFGIHLLVRTGSADHNMWLAGYAISNGMRIKYSEGLIKEGTAIAGEDEKGVFTALGLPYPLPSEREIVNDKPVWMPPVLPNQKITSHSVE